MTALSLDAALRNRFGDLVPEDESRPNVCRSGLGCSLPHEKMRRTRLAIG